MKFHTPEIAWHNRDPVLSVDFHEQLIEDGTVKAYRAATAGYDAHVIIWKISLDDSVPDGVDPPGFKPDRQLRGQLPSQMAASQLKVECLADLHRHQRAVNVVRFAPKECPRQLLASGDDEGVIFVWIQGDGDMNRSMSSPVKDDLDSPSKTKGETGQPLNGEPKAGPSSEEARPEILFGEDEPLIENEHWTVFSVLRGHLDDVSDLAWSSDGKYLISGSVDNTAIVWDPYKKTKIAILNEHKGFVQGVSWDPLNQYVATLCSDRNLRIYSTKNHKTAYRVKNDEVVIEIKNTSGQIKSGLTKTSLFYDDTLRSYCRRLAWSPHGEFLIAPSGIVEIPQIEEVNKKEARNMGGDQENFKAPNQPSAKKKASPTNLPSKKLKTTHEPQDPEPKEISKQPETMECGDDAEPEAMEVDMKPEKLNESVTESTPLKEIASKPNATPAASSSNHENFTVGPSFSSSLSSQKFINCIHLFSRSGGINKVAAWYPTGKKFTLAARCCPALFTLRDDNLNNPFSFPYRMVFAVATQDEIIFYDTQNELPIAMVKQIHYTRLSDITWSPDGRLLMISSTDGFCTFVTFKENELGMKYDGLPVHMMTPVEEEIDESISGPDPADFLDLELNTPQTVPEKLSPPRPSIKMRRIESFFRKAESKSENLSESKVEEEAKPMEVDQKEDRNIVHIYVAKDEPSSPPPSNGETLGPITPQTQPISKTRTELVAAMFRKKNQGSKPCDQKPEELVVDLTEDDDSSTPSKLSPTKVKKSNEAAKESGREGSAKKSLGSTENVALNNDSSKESIAGQKPSIVENGHHDSQPKTPSINGTPGGLKEEEKPFRRVQLITLSAPKQ